MSKDICQACDHPLDERGCCQRCAGALPEDLEALKFTNIKWTVCAIHGAHEADSNNRYCVTISEPNPKDRRKKITHHEWHSRCTPCMVQSADYRNADLALTFKDKIMLPPEVYQPLVDERVKRWKDRT